MFVIRPITTLAIGGVGLALVAIDLLRSNVSFLKPVRTDVTRPADDTVILSSERLFELNKSVPADEVNPELIATSLTEATEALLEAADNRGRALDWSTFRSHIFAPVTALQSAEVIVRVDVL